MRIENKKITILMTCVLAMLVISNLQATEPTGRARSGGVAPTFIAPDVAEKLQQMRTWRLEHPAFTDWMTYKGEGVRPDLGKKGVSGPVAGYHKQLEKAEIVCREQGGAPCKEAVEKLYVDVKSYVDNYAPPAEKTSRKTAQKDTAAIAASAAARTTVTMKRAQRQVASPDAPPSRVAPPLPARKRADAGKPPALNKPN